MVPVIDALICTVVLFAILVTLRWAWLYDQRKKLTEGQPAFDDERFERRSSDEDDQFFSGRVVKRLRSRGG